MAFAIAPRLLRWQALGQCFHRHVARKTLIEPDGVDDRCRLPLEWQIAGPVCALGNPGMRHVMRVIEALDVALSCRGLRGYRAIGAQIKRSAIQMFNYAHHMAHSWIPK